VGVAVSSWPDNYSESPVQLLRETSAFVGHLLLSLPLSARRRAFRISRIILKEMHVDKQAAITVKVETNGNKANLSKSNKKEM
jgi:hypothetical protein